MRKIKRLVVIGGFFFLAAKACFAQDTIPWRRDIPDAKKEASQQNKLVLIHFWSRSCGPCRSLERYVFPHPEVNRSITENYIPVKVNVLGQPDLARQFGVEKIPTDVIITADGNELSRQISPDSASGYIQLVNRVAANARMISGNPMQQLAQAAQTARQRPVVDPREPFDARMSSYQEQLPTGPSSEIVQIAATNDLRSAPYEQHHGPTFGQGYQYDPNPVWNMPANPTWQPPHTVGGGDFQPPGPASRPAMIEDRQANPQWNSPHWSAATSHTDSLPPNAASNPPGQPTPDGSMTNPYMSRGRLFDAPGSQPGHQAASPPVPSRSDPTYNPYLGNNPGKIGPRQQEYVDGHSFNNSHPSYNTAGSDAAIAGPPAASNRGAPTQGGQTWAPDQRPHNHVPNNHVPNVNAPHVPSQPGPTGFLPPRQNSENPAAAPASRPAAGLPTQPGSWSAPRHEDFALALDGCCPVSLTEPRDARQTWVKGDARWGAIHRGRTYLFASPDHQRKFLENPDVYSPALSGFDAVRYVERNEFVEGKREHGVSYRGQVFLFADEASLQMFWQNPARYARIVHEAMRKNALSSRR